MTRMYGVPDPRDASGPAPTISPTTDTTDDNAEWSPIREAYVVARRDALERKTGRPSAYGTGRIPKWDGGTDSVGRRHKPIWPKVAKYLASKDGVDIPTFMAAQFVDGRLRKPTELYAASAWKRYEEYIAASAALVAQKLKGDTIRFKQAVADAAFHTSGEDKKTLWYLALSNPLAQLSPLFRYCVAISLNWFEFSGTRLLPL